MDTKKAVVLGLSVMLLSAVHSFADDYFSDVDAARVRWCHAHGAIFKSELEVCNADLNKWRDKDINAYCSGIGLVGDNLDTCVEDVLE